MVTVRGIAMKEYLDIRLSEEWAQQHLDDSWGQVMSRDLPVDPATIPPSLMTRQIIMESNDDRLAVLTDRMAKFPPRMTAIEFRKYSAAELSEAPMLQLIIRKFVDACGEDYGTLYDESTACPRCAFGRKQMSPLRLDLAKIPKGADIATTIARGEEILVSESVAQIIREGSIAGCRLDAVEHVGRRSEQARWYQLVITASAGETVPSTRFAKDFFREDTAQEFVCPQHGLSGLNLVSEVFLRKTSIEAADILKTTNRYGTKQGWLVPSPVFLISQRFYRLLEQRSVRGYKVEVARLVT